MARGKSAIRGIRGAPDLLPEQMAAWHRVEAVTRRLMAAYGYEEIRTPVFEKTDLFIRSIGAGTDIVEKEMYTFEDRGGESLTLRPEGTAPVIRAYLEHRLDTRGPLLKVYYLGPMFRHERPQAGRFRQFHQIGAEAIGLGTPAVDAEILTLLAHLFEALEVRGLVLELNSIGDAVCRPAFRERFAAYMRSRRAELCPDCHVRLERNPLRILDCKVERCRAVAAEAPKPSAMLCAACEEHFHEVQSLLALLKIDFTLNDRLVRGLDYYTRTTFEFVNPELGAQNAVAGGGRYDGLVEELGGPPTPGIGFAVGMERLVASLPKGEGAGAAATSGVFVAALGAEAFRSGLLLLQDLRRRGVRAGTDLEGRSLRGQLRAADKDRYRFAVILGDDELKAREVVVRDLRSGEQAKVPISRVVEHLAGALEGEGGG
ncbi:MAG TPA: histidine--tRNA ligase [Candidatus Methylomirabilis sp.]|jgi:histidyl-tRNA synthetase|nr:histidine--tRNA ligase [Candidatus Methylomirabilis sp.]